MSLGLNASLYMGARALSNAQLGIEVTGNNISNVNTPGVARQRVNIRQDLVLEMGNTYQGTGSFVESIQSLRNKLLDDQVIRQESLSGFYDMQEQLLSFAQDALGESLSTSDSSATEGIQSTTGIQQSLNAFFDAWQALSNDPNSDIARNNVLTQADNLINDIKSTYTRLMDLRKGVFEQASQTSDEINSLTEEIALLNNQISKAEVGTTARANDLRDQRQRAIEELSKLVNITITNHTSGSDAMVDIALTSDANAVLVNGTYGGGAGSGADASYRLDIISVAPATGLVDGTASVDNTYNPTTNSIMRLVYTNSTSAPNPSNGDAIPGTVVTPTEGEMGAMLDVSNNQIGFGHQPPVGGGTATPTDSLVYRINQFAVNLISKVNTVHTTNAWDQNGVAGVAFFTAGGNAYNISLGAGITGPDKLAAAQGVTFPGNLNGDNAQDMYVLRDDSALGASERQMVTDLGADVLQAQRNQTSQQLIQTQIEKQRDSVSGISIDEEMTNLMVFQRAFESSARFINVIDEMMQIIVSLGR